MISTNRPYQDARDIGHMKRVAADAFRRVPCHPYAGIEWVVFGPHGFPPQAIVHLQERDGTVVGWVTLSSAEGFDYRVAADLLGTPLEAELVGWGTQGVLSWRAVSKLEPRCVVDCWGGDVSRAEILSRRGYQAKSVVGVVFTQSLEHEIEAPRLPDHWSLHGLTDEDVESRAQTQYEAFAPGSHTTPATWRRLMEHAPGYDPDLDSVAISPEGDVCAAALAWIDPHGLIGEFEPVGTRPQFQRRGLGKAVLLRGLAKMRECQMGTAIVGTNSENTAAIALYESVGFTIANRVTSYELTANGA